MAITLDGTNGITTPDVDTDGLTVDTNTLFVDAANNRVGVGTTAPATALHVVGSVGDTALFGGINAGSGTENIGGIQLGVSTDNASRRVWGIKSESVNTGMLGVWVSADNASSAFSGTQVVSIDSSGNLLVGTTTGGYKFRVEDVNNRSEADAQVRISGNGYSLFCFLDGTAAHIGQNSNNRALRMYSGGNPAVGVNLAAGGNSWGTYSDERVKDIIEPIEGGVEKLSQLRTVIGKYKFDDADKRRVFLIAQDVQKVLPEAVIEDDSGDLSLQYQDLIPVLVKAIQEQQAIIEALEARVAALETNA